MARSTMSSRDSGNDDCEPKGDCFVAAFDALFELIVNAESRQFFLVHGNVARLPQDVDVNHAWVENETTVFDYSNGIQTQMSKDTYYSELQITETRQYTPIEAMQMNTQYGHYGAWPQ